MTGGDGPMTTEFKRLGKHGSYRLGRLRARGVRESGQAPFRPSFARNPRRGPASAWAVALFLGALVIAGFAVAGWWFVPFIAGLAAGLANRIGGWRTPIALPAVIVMAVVGWAIPLAWQEVHDGLTYRVVAREVAALLGLPAHSLAGFTLTMLVAVVQAAVGYWLGRALTPRPLVD
jgi:hypothetical protein